MRRAFGRYVLTLVGSTLGVAVLFGVLTTNASIKAGLDRVLGSRRVPTVAVVPIGSYGNTLPASMLDRVATLPDVGRVSATVFVNAAVAGTDTELNIYGQRWTDGPARASMSDGPFEHFGFDGRDPARGADEVSLGRSRARELGVSLGDTVDLTTRSGPLRLTVVRIVDVPDPNGLVSFETAVRIQGQGDVVQSLSAQLADGTSTDEWAAAHGGSLGNVRVDPSPGEDLRNVVAVIQSAFSALGLMAAFVGGFLIYLTLSTSVAERARTWGVLRAVGARRRDVVRVVLGEAIVIGAVATAAGIALGAMLGTGLLRFSRAMFDLPAAGTTITVGAVVGALVLGLAIPPLAAALPAWRAARAEPVDSMRDRHVDGTRLGRSWVIGAVLLVVALLLARTGGTTGGLRAAPLLFLFGAVLVVPVALAPLARLTGAVSARLAPGLGEAAVKHLVRERARSAYTLGLIMVVLALVLAIGAMQASLVGALHDAFRIRYGADVTVWAWNGMPDEVAAAIASVDGAERSTHFRSGRVGIGPDNEEVELVVIEPDSFFAIQGFPWIDGDDASARDALVAGGAVVVPEVYAAREGGLRRGARLAMQTTAGTRELTVAGVYATPESGVRVVVGETDGRRLFNAGPITGFELVAAPGLAPEELKARVEAVIADKPGFFVNTIEAEEREIAAALEANFRPFLAVTLLAGIVGILGLANTLGMGIIRRTREIGVLRAVGIGRRALGRMVLVEALTMTTVAFVLSLPLGWLMARAILRSSSAAIGFLVDLRAPWALVPWLLVAVVVIAAIASVGPARRIARLDPVDALRYE